MTDALSPAGPLSAALARLAADPQDTSARLAFHAALSAAELCVWLATEAEGDRLDPQVFALEDGPTVLAFDSEATLAGFAGQAVPYAALPGRVLVGMLAGAGNLSLLVQDDSGAAELMPPEALDWLARTLSGPAPRAGQGVARDYGPPDLPGPVLATLVAALERRLSGVPGLTGAVLASVGWAAEGPEAPAARGHLLALSGLPPSAEAPLARAVTEALELSGAALPALDVVFPQPAAMARIAALGLSLAPAPFVPPSEPAPSAPPGGDPARPPRLR